MSEGIQETASSRIEQVEYDNSLLNSTLHFFDYIFLLRPTLFFPVWTVFAAGFIAAIRFETGQAHGVADAATYGMFLMAGLGLTLLMGGVFIINQLADEEIDRSNNKLFLIANGCVSKSAARIETGIVSLVGLALAGIVSWRLAVVFVIVFAVTGALYSLPPFKWKDKALPGLLLNALGAMLVFFAGWLTHLPLGQESLFASIPYILSVTAVYLYTTLLDQEGDQQHQKTTFAVQFGKKNTIRFGAVLLFAGLILSYLDQDAVIFYPALFAFPLFLVAAFREEIRDADRAIKYPIFFLALAVSMIWNWFFVLIIVTYYLSKAYYKYRFGVNYPSFEKDPAIAPKK